MFVTKRKLPITEILVALLHCSHGFCLEDCCEKETSVLRNFDIPSRSSTFSAGDKFRNTELEFQRRWRDFGGATRNFPLWNSHWREEDLKIRFNQMKEERWGVYFDNPEDVRKENAFGRWKEAFQMPDNWKSFFSRYPYPIVFTYNLAYPNYAASIVTLHGKHFIAMEAPTKNNLNRFFRLIDEYNVTHIVRLTPAYGDGRENSVPYWEGRTNIHSDNGRPTLQITEREIYYFPTDLWQDHEGFEPERLLALVKAVMNAGGTDPKLIAVHCRAGVGRTGAFLAAYMLIDAIDKQIANGIDVDHLEISIDKVIWELSLQRSFAVPHFSQYLTLYQFVNLYVNSLKTR